MEFVLPHVHDSWRALRIVAMSIGDALSNVTYSAAMTQELYPVMAVKDVLQ
jgi:hypothetical protein